MGRATGGVDTRPVSRGARGLKLWKDVGLTRRDENDKLFLLGDPRLEPVWAAVAEARIPVLVHSADPAAFFRPLDETNERLEELIRHPDWHFYGPQFPTMMELLDALERVVANNPTIPFIAAHVGCYAEDLGWVDRVLTAYPNFNVDISARIAELGRQPRAARRLVLKHPDRVVLGTDVFPPTASAYRRYLRFLSTDDENFPYSDSNPPGTGRWRISAIDLPADVLTKVTRTNAERIVPSLTVRGVRTCTDVPVAIELSTARGRRSPDSSGEASRSARRFNRQAFASITISRWSREAA